MILATSSRLTRVIVGVDTHRDEHVAVAIDCLGARLGQRRLPTAPRDYESLHCWPSGLGEVVAFGIEGTGSYGAGLTRYLAGLGQTVIEVTTSGLNSCNPGPRPHRHPRPDRPPRSPPTPPAPRYLRWTTRWKLSRSIRIGFPKSAKSTLPLWGSSRARRR